MTSVCSDLILCVSIHVIQHITTKPPAPSSRVRSKRQRGGLSGGSSTCDRTTDHAKGVDGSLSSDQFPASLCQEIHRLLRVMWSGKWAVVTPHTVLTSIWHHVPSFRGYCQQDAQEFLWYVCVCI